MKVKELIAKLQEFDGELEIVSNSDFGYHKLSIVEVQEKVNIYESYSDEEILDKALWIA